MKLLNKYGVKCLEHRFEHQVRTPENGNKSMNYYQK